MCYSAMVQQKLKELNLRWDTRMDITLIEELFLRRKNGEKLSISKAFESNFLHPKDANEKKIKKDIEDFRNNQIAELEAELFAQITRHNKAVETSALKVTKKATNDRDVSERQIARIKKRLEKIKTDKPQENDSRIYAFDWAPVIIWKDGERVAVPMRYHLRPPGMQVEFDRRYPGCYNARRDSLTGFWKNEFGSKHGILIISSFFENVKRHDLEQRGLENGEKEENVVLQFKPTDMDYMIVPCIWDTWIGKDGETLNSFALITDEPPREVSETGHDRCPIFIKEERINDWLNPEGKSQKELFEILDDRQRPYYKHALAG